MEQFITMDPAFAEGSLDLRQKTYLWHAQGELPSERSRLKSLQSVGGGRGMTQRSQRQSKEL